MSPFNSAAGLTTLLAVFLLIPILYYRRRDLRAFRLRHDRLRELLKIGLLAAILLIPLTMAINVIVGLLVTPYSHPVIDTLLAEASVETLIYTVITVVVAAPIVEEFVFRGVVLTYLQRAFSGNWATNTLILCKHSEKPENQFKAADTFQRHGANLLTSLIFASLHLGQGAGWLNPHAPLHLGQGSGGLNPHTPCTFRRCGRVGTHTPPAPLGPAPLVNTSGGNPLPPCTFRT